MARVAVKKAVAKKTVEVKKLTWDTLKNGICYVGKSGKSSYYFLKDGNKNIPYIYNSTYYEDGYLGSVGIYEEVEEILAGHITKCLKTKKYTKMPEVGKYVLTIGNLNYDAAIEQRGKIVWSLEIEPILHLLKEDLVVKATGIATKKPKTLKELKKLIT
jgi:hypothetical protein